MSKSVVLTGLRANSEFHLGNYLGGILPVIELQTKHAGEYQVNMFVPDLHSFTTPIDHARLYQQTIDNLKVFVAAGLNISDPDTFIYRQSYIPAHSELAWILDCFTGMGELSRMTQYKDKSGVQDLFEHAKYAIRIMKESNQQTVRTGEEYQMSLEKKNFELDKTLNAVFDVLGNLMSSAKSSENTNAGLFNYPVLMAADILLYDAKYIPVGDDQKQHIELTRDLAIRLNNKFEQELFVVPEPWAKQMEFASRDNGVRIRSLRNPDKKMSKSVDDPSGTITLSDDPAAAAKKIMRAETDSVGAIHYDFESQPGISNLLQILALLSGKSQATVNAEWEGKSSYGELKTATAEAVANFLTDFQAKLAAVDEQQVFAKLEQHEKAMNITANKTLLKVQKAVGLRK